MNLNWDALLMAVATITPLVPRHAAQAARIEPVIPALPAPAPVEAVEPDPVSVPLIDADEAIEIFVREMCEGDGQGSDLPFSRIAQNYEIIGRGRGWPPVTNKLLGLRLARCGCVRFIRDNRPKGGGKIVCYRFPDLDDDGAILDPVEIAA